MSTFEMSTFDGLPNEGTDWDTLRAEMIERGTGDAKWREGKTAVYVFNAGEEVTRVQKEAYALYMSENGLGPLAFPSLKQMEDEVVAIGLDLLHGGEGAVGNITSGGTDSITMALKAARSHARAAAGNGAASRSGAVENVVLASSAHLAFDKAAALMDVEVRRVPVGEDLVADVAAMAEAVDDGTVMLVGSAPCFPYGLMDPIEALGELASATDTWLHVDACVGGYIAPFVRMNGSEIAPFDFEVPAVASMSADLHKYGYCAKGASTVLFRSDELRGHMVFDFDAWPGGRMVTPTLAGTRPGGAISAAWAVMHHLGIDGYRAKQQMVTDAREAIEEGVTDLGFEVLGEPALGIVAFSHPDLDIYGIYRQMYKRGWITALTTDPPALHLMLSPIHRDLTDVYLGDLRASMDVVRDSQSGDRSEERRSEVRYS